MSTIEVSKRKSDYATLDGAGVTYEANGDYSITPAVFEWGPPTGEIWHAERLIVLIRDAGNADASEYGNLGAALTTGIVVQFRSGVSTVEQTLNGLKPIKTNSDWAGLCYDTRNLGLGGAGDDAYSAMWTFSRDLGGSGIRLNGDDDERITILLSDNLSGLSSHTFFVGGYKV